MWLKLPKVWRPWRCKGIEKTQANTGNTTTYGKYNQTQKCCKQHRRQKRLFPGHIKKWWAGTCLCLPRLWFIKLLKSAKRKWWWKISQLSILLLCLFVCFLGGGTRGMSTLFTLFSVTWKWICLCYLQYFSIFVIFSDSIFLNAALCCQINYVF